MGCLFNKGTLKEVSMNGHSSNIGYIFISFTKFFLKFTSLVRLQQRAQNAFFMLNKTFLIFIIF